MPWLHCPNKNVYSDRQNLWYNKFTPFRYVTRQRLDEVGSYFITDTAFWLQTWSTVTATTDLLCSRWRSLVECRSRAVVCPTSAWRDVSRPHWQRVNWQVQALHNHTHTHTHTHMVRVTSTVAHSILEVTLSSYNSKSASQTPTTQH